MKRLLVILHVYYQEQVDWFIDKLKNIHDCSWDLIVTYSDLQESTAGKIRSFKDDAVFLEVENVGYDVWPFIKVIKSIDLKEYDLVMKLHTKNRDNYKVKINGLKLIGESWRNLLVDGLLKSRNQFAKCLDIFANNPDAGMVCSYELLVLPSMKYQEDTCLLSAETKRIGITRQRQIFCCGTMFIAKPECLEPIIGAELDNTVWGEGSKSHSSASLAHVYERVFGAAVSETGYKILGIPAQTSTYLSVRLHKTISPILKSLVTVNYGEDGEKYMMIFGKKIFKI